jgi:hypothetical protein
VWIQKAVLARTRERLKEKEGIFQQNIVLPSAIKLEKKKEQERMTSA